MRAKSLYLLNFIPLSFLSGIKEFTYNVDQPIQLILGGNGSGKSSIMGVLGPVMITPSMFEVPGEWRFTFDDNGSEYELAAVIEKTGTKWYFTKDGNVLNDGGNSHVQKHLLSEHFNYTADNHKALTGQMNFCTMGDTARNEFIRNFAGIDFKYALSIFTKITKTVQYTKGALMFAGTRLSESEALLASIDVPDDIEERINSIERSLIELMPLTNRTLGSTVTGVYEQARLGIEKELTDLTSMCHKLLNANEKFVREHGYVTEADAIELEKKCISIGSLIADSNAKFSTLRELAATVDKCQQYDTTYVSGLKSKMAELTRDLPNVPETLLGLNSEALLKLRDLLYEVREGIQGEYTLVSPDIINGTSSELQEVHNAEVVALEEQSRLITRVGHLRAHEEQRITCPKCKTNFSTDGSCHAEGLKLAESKLTDITSTLNELRQRKASLSARLEQAHANNSHAEKIRNFIKSTPALMPIAVHFKSPVNMLNNMASVMQTIVSIVTHNDISKDIKSVNDKLDEAVASLGILASIGGEDPHKAMEVIEAKVNELYDELDSTKKRLANVSRGLKLADRTLNSLTELDRVIIKWSDNLNGAIVYEDTVETNALVDRLQTQIVELRSLSVKFKTISIEIDSLRERIANMEHKLKLQNELAKIHSPSKGIVAEVMKDVTESFLKQLNSVLGKIWTYDLCITSSTTANGTKFGTIINDKVGPALNLLSRGQQDVVNFAITLMMKEYYNLKDYPLFLDEVGSSFDYEHRRSFLDYVVKLSMSDMCSQVFMIQQYSEDYGGIPHSDTIVINGKNIIVPDNVSYHNFNMVYH